MWPSAHTHYNDQIEIRDKKDQDVFMSEVSSIDSERLMTIKHERIGDSMPISSNIAVHQVLAARVWIKKWEHKELF